VPVVIQELLTAPFWNELTVSPVRDGKWTSSEFHRGAKLTLLIANGRKKNQGAAEELQRQQQKRVSPASINKITYGYSGILSGDLNCKCAEVNCRSE